MGVLVGTSVAVTVGVGVSAGVGVAVGVGTGVLVGMGVAVSVGVLASVGVSVEVGVGVLAGTGLAVAVGVDVNVGTGIDPTASSLDVAEAVGEGCARAMLSVDGCWTSPQAVHRRKTAQATTIPTVSRNVWFGLRVNSSPIRQ